MIFSQLSNEVFAKVKEIVNGADNVNIVPIHVFEEVSGITFIFSLLNFHLTRNVE